MGEREPNAKWLTEGVILAALSALAYVVALVWEAGTWLYFEIPIDLMRFDSLTLARTLLVAAFAFLMFLIGFVVIRQAMVEAATSTNARLGARKEEIEERMARMPRWCTWLLMFLALAGFAWMLHPAFAGRYREVCVLIAYSVFDWLACVSILAVIARQDDDERAPRSGIVARFARFHCRNKKALIPMLSVLALPYFSFTLSTKMAAGTKEFWVLSPAARDPVAIVAFTSDSAIGFTYENDDQRICGRRRARSLRVIPLKGEHVQTFEWVALGPLSPASLQPPSECQPVSASGSHVSKAARGSAFRAPMEEDADAGVSKHR